ncbi:unnamed protein product [Onchocerca flexuosa]|nr:unnamed protein product [Onchocerca flexuosa]
MNRTYILRRGTITCVIKQQKVFRGGGTLLFYIRQKHRIGWHCELMNVARREVQMVSEMMGKNGLKASTANRSQNTNAGWTAYTGFIQHVTETVHIILLTNPRAITCVLTDLSSF